MVKYIHGSEDSIDKDVYYVFDKLPSFRECQHFCSKDPEENRNIIVINNGVVTDCFKGTPDEINNGLLYTYAFHKQEYPLLIKKLICRDILLKTVRAIRCFLSHCSRTQYRTEVKDALNSSEWKVRLKVLINLDITKIEDYGKNRKKEDIFKTFAFQLGQSLALFEGQELYTKGSIAITYPALTSFIYRKKDVDVSILQDLKSKLAQMAASLNIHQENNLIKYNNKYFDLKKEAYVREDSKR